MLYRLMYEIVLWLAALLVLPKMLYQMIVKKKYRASFFKRWGWGFPHIEKGTRKLFWIHAVSVGEVKAVAPLVKRLKQEGNPLILISTITETGLAEAKKSIPEAEHHVFLPFDFYGVIVPIVHNVKPDMVILCETDFWLNFLYAAKDCGAAIALVNGKISELSLKRFKAFSGFSKQLFKLIDIFCLQSEHHLRRFEELNIPEAKLTVTSNLKFDGVPTLLSAVEKDNLKAKLGLTTGQKVAVLGSTHDPEEHMLLQAFKNLWLKDPSLKVIVVPRHPERFNLVAALLKNQGIPFDRYSHSDPSPQSKVCLLDTMGMLGACYQIADLAVVAGSYTAKVGGHNILEPLWHGVPTVFGPHMHGQPELVEVVAEYRAAKQLPIEQFEAAVERLLQGGEEAESLRLNALKLVKDARGSLQRTLEQLQKLAKF